MIEVDKPSPPVQYERRASTSAEDIKNAPEGTMVTVPKAAPSGGTVEYPFVGVRTKSKWADPVFLLTFVNALGSMATAIFEIVPEAGDINWRSVGPKILFAVINGVAAFLRTQLNTVTR